MCWKTGSRPWCAHKPIFEAPNPQKQRSGAWKPDFCHRSYDQFWIILNCFPCLDTTHDANQSSGLSENDVSSPSRQIRGSAPPGSDSGLDDSKYSGLGSALVCPLRMIAFRKRRFGLLNTGIYLILSGSSDHLMLPGFLPNEFLWLDAAQPSWSAPVKWKNRWGVAWMYRCCWWGS